MKILRPIFLIMFVPSLLVLSSGCASTSSQLNENSLPAEVQHNQHDPLQPLNRKILEFNLAVDDIALKPVAKAYTRLPQPVRNGIGNFFANLWMPNTILNDLLQGKFAHAGRDTGRFLINTFIGAAGLMDAAREFGFPQRTEDFGQTLAVWGVPSGAYLVLPLLGPRNIRDSVALFRPLSNTDLVNSLDGTEEWFARGIRLVDTRADFLGLDEVLELQPDQYLFLREGYRQRRTQLIYDGNPPPQLNRASETQLQDELLQ